MLKIIPLKEERLEDAALLVSRRNQRLREQAPHRYWQVSLLAVSFAVMLGAIFLSMQIA